MQIEMTYIAHYDSPLGSITLTSDGEAITGLCFGESTEYCVSPLSSFHSPLSTCIRWLDLYFAGCEPDFTPQLIFKGTDFQRRVWRAICEIPYGQTVTYGDIARSIGCRSAQAVGGAVGRNPIAIIVPCHRVVGRNGSLTGYAYGLDKKQYLLHLESRNRLTVAG